MTNTPPSSSQLAQEATECLICYKPAAVSEDGTASLYCDNRTCQPDWKLPDDWQVKALGYGLYLPHILADGRVVATADAAADSEVMAAGEARRVLAELRHSGQLSEMWHFTEQSQQYSWKVVETEAGYLPQITDAHTNEVIAARCSTLPFKAAAEDEAQIVLADYYAGRGLRRMWHEVEAS